jgi:hypothetical protein
MLGWFIKRMGLTACVAARPEVVEWDDGPSGKCAEMQSVIDTQDKMIVKLDSDISAKLNKVKLLLKNGNKALARECLKQKKMLEAKRAKTVKNRDMVISMQDALISACETRRFSNTIRQGFDELQKITKSMPAKDVRDTVTGAAHIADEAQRIQDYMESVTFSADSTDDTALDKELETLENEEVEMALPNVPMAPAAITVESITDDQIAAPSDAGGDDAVESFADLQKQLQGDHR